MTGDGYGDPNMWWRWLRWDPSSYNTVIFDVVRDAGTSKKPHYVLLIIRPWLPEGAVVICTGREPGDQHWG